MSKDRFGQAQEYLNAAAIHLRFGRHTKADVILAEAWRVFSDGLSMDDISSDDLRTFGVLARIAGVGETPETALARVRSAVDGRER